MNNNLSWNASTPIHLRIQTFKRSQKRDEYVYILIGFILITLLLVSSRTHVHNKHSTHVSELKWMDGCYDNEIKKKKYERKSVIVCENFYFILLLYVGYVFFCFVIHGPSAGSSSTRCSVHVYTGGYECKNALLIRMHQSSETLKSIHVYCVFMCRRLSRTFNIFIQVSGFKVYLFYFVLWICVCVCVSTSVVLIGFKWELAVTVNHIFRTSIQAWFFFCSCL